MNALARLFFRLGITAFGGPSAHVALMEREVVTRRGWMTRAEFLDHQGLVQVLPGPTSTELAIHLGHARAGWRGALVAGLCFVLPSVVLVWVLAAISHASALAGVTGAVLWWLAPVVVVIIAEALWKFGRQASVRRGALAVMPLTALATCLELPDPLVLLLGAVLAIGMWRPPPGAAGASGMLGMLSGAVISAGSLGAQASVAVGAVPGTAVLFLYFLRAGVSVFGSGYVLLAFLQRDLVTTRGWMSMDALLHASALAQITPGPLFSTATAAGYFIGGTAGALAATVGIFAPAFASVAIAAPVRRLVQRSPAMRHALDGVVIASVSLLGRALAGFAVPLHGWQWAVCAGAAVSLLRSRVEATGLLVAAVAIGVAGVVLHSLRP